MRAILVSVDYADLLSVTLPFNRHHFSEVLIVTTPQDIATQQVAANCNAQVHLTESFYDNGADFNKWKALEEGLDKFGREGLLCIMDADILWPKQQLLDSWFELGYLYTPKRRLLYNLAYTKEVALNENQWYKVPVANEPQWAGYTQIFHANDYHLPVAPWHELNWRHAGGADSGFQDLWPASNKVRPAWTVIHLGVAGMNWCGRATPYLDGTTNTSATDRRERMHNYYARRHFATNQQEIYAAEKLPKPKGVAIV